jgi:enterochelin esterase-like enzyme
MRKILVLTLAFLVVMTFPSMAQQAVSDGTAIISPEIHEDHSVTFMVLAPGADQVKLTGDWMPAEGWVPGTVDMERDEKGVWSHTTAVMAPELYGYAFLIDGVRTNDPSNVFLSRDVATNTNIFLVEGEGSDLYRVNELSHGSVIQRWYHSPGLERNRRMTIYTPPGYETSQASYPVLYLLHGAGGDEEAWMELGRCTQIMDKLIAQGKAEPMIVVMPNGNVSQGAAPGQGLRGFYQPQFMVPGTMDGTFEATFIDILKFVEDSYRVKADKQHRAVAGLSMGGFHSMHISRYYPETFDYVGLFSPAILPYQNKTAKAYQDMEGTRIRQMENGYKLYWIGIGKDDPLFRNVRAYHLKLETMEMPHTYKVSEGGHIWSNWRVYLSEFVPQLFK